MTGPRASILSPNAADALRKSLASIGVAGRVEARERLAVIIAADPGILLDAEWRRRALMLAREHGFTNLALEIAEDTTTRASLSGD